MFIYSYRSAGVDRLDKELAVGQMQGKFQMQIVGHVGHAVHEDAPDKVIIYPAWNYTNPSRNLTYSK